MINHATLCGILFLIFGLIEGRIYLVEDDPATAMKEIDKMFKRDVEGTSFKYPLNDHFIRKKKKIKVRFKPPSPDYVKNILKAIKQYYEEKDNAPKEKDRKRVCDRHFGSIFGVKSQKARCLYGMKMSKKMNKFTNVEDSTFIDETVRSSTINHNPYPFRVNGLNGINNNLNIIIIKKVSNVLKSPSPRPLVRFSYDYYDDTRRSHYGNFFDNVDYDSRENIEDYDGNKENADSETDNSDAESKESNSFDSLGGKQLKRNRFEVVDNVKAKKKNRYKFTQKNKQVFSSIESDESTVKPKTASINATKKKRKAKNKEKSKKVYYMQGKQRIIDSDDENGNDVEKIARITDAESSFDTKKDDVSSFETNKDDASSFESNKDIEDELSSPETRKHSGRLPHFMPKRYYWDPDDYHHLGHFWYNGPQGVVSHIRTA